MRANKRARWALAVALVIGSGSSMISREAEADVFECDEIPGTLAGYDFSTGGCVTLSGNISNWTRLGLNIFDQFVNNHATESVCLYSGTGFSGVSVRLGPGDSVTWPNAVRSNRFTTDPTC